ncbi:MAG: BsuPI-related putative proteinase inhibitor [Chloroflexota bacterium]|nr:BsuPI-related putative proteinase inhibitor [Chloroflexota bacterium]
MQRYVLVFLVSLLVVAAGAACDQGEEGSARSPTPEAARPSPEATPAFSFQGPVGIDLTTFGVFHRQEEPVSLTVVVAAGEPITLYYRTTQRFDIVVTDSEGREVWRWSQGKAFSQVLEQVELKPGEPMAFTERWDQRDNDGQPVPPGNYSVAATSTHCDANYENCGQLTVSRILQIRAS